MIINFKCKETQKIWYGDISKYFPTNIQQVARRKLRMLNNARKINDLSIPPSNHLEMLQGKRKGEYSIRINKQWRICFQWLDNNAADVIVEDYH